jgi:hypothetical protein
VNFDGEDMCLEMQQNTFNALVNSVEEFKFIVTDKKVNGSNIHAEKNDKRKKCHLESGHSTFKYVYFVIAKQCGRVN